MPTFKILVLSMLGLMSDVQAEVRFHCPTQLAQLQPNVAAYLRSRGIPADQVVQTIDLHSGDLTLALATPPEDIRTLDFSTRPELALSPEQVYLPGASGVAREVSTVSRKEIVLAMLQHGRLTTLTGTACAIEAWIDLVDMRQNIVAWAENLNWVWPNGGRAKWNQKYWTHGTPKRGVSVRLAVLDTFLHQKKYSIGCYAATKLLMVQGVLDYYHRVKADPVRARRVEAALLADGEPLMGVEPAKMWRFEKDYIPVDGDQQGKLLALEVGVAQTNFVPGDWAYFLNTDAITYEKIGYEGSNAIYLGGNRFDDFYNDHRHSYTYQEKLNEVYQWRNGVFSRSGDADKIKPLTPEQLNGLSRSPADGGLQLDIRVSPRLF